jgi:hypothetical protein
MEKVKVLISEIYTKEHNNAMEFILKNLSGIIILDVKDSVINKMNGLLYTLMVNEEVKEVLQALSSADCLYLED